MGCPGDQPRGLELGASGSSREGILPGQVWVAGRLVKVATMEVGGRAVLRATAAWVWGSGKRFSTPIQSGKVQMGPGQWPGSCLALRLVYTQGSRWNRGQHSPGGVLSAVLWSVAPLGASLCSDLPAGEGRGETVLPWLMPLGGALATLSSPLESLGPFTAAHQTPAPRPWGEASGSRSHPRP